MLASRRQPKAKKHNERRRDKSPRRLEKLSKNRTTDDCAAIEVQHHTYLLPGGLAEVKTESTIRAAGGKRLRGVLSARVYLREDGNWPLPSMPQILLEQIQTAVRRHDDEFSSFSSSSCSSADSVYPAVGYFNIISDRSPVHNPQRLRMGAFYSALAFLPKTQPEMRGFMAAALKMVLSHELQRGTFTPDMVFCLEASGRLRSKDMHGLVDYYHNKLGLDVVRPDSFDQDVESGAVVMEAPLSKILSTS